MTQVQPTRSPTKPQSSDPLSEAIELLTEAGYSTEIEDALQVYANRDLRMSEIDWIGFDMDYTLALYHQEALDELSFRHTLDSLVDKFGYPERVRQIHPDHDFAIRGLIIDRKLGNILKMDSHGSVGKACHGLRPMNKDDMRHYQDQHIKVADERFVLVDTLFSLPETFLYAALIDFFEADSAPVQTLDYWRLYDDVRGAIDLAHADGRIKREILQNIPKYVTRDETLAPTLHKFRSAGKHLFLLTNSEWYYTQHVMEFLLGGDGAYQSWRNYFDIIVTTSCKPSFFRGSRPFERLTDAGEVDNPEANSLERGRIYQFGNLVDFERMLGIKGGSRVLYIGDHIYGDIVRSRRDSAWRTCMVIQEMEIELKKAGLMRKDLLKWADLDQRMASINSDMNAQRHMVSRLEEAYPDEVSKLDTKPGKARKQLKLGIDQLSKMRRGVLSALIELDEEISKNFNRYWGLLFKEGAEHSVFGGQVEEYAGLYTSRVSNLRRYSPMRYFRARRQVMPHEQLS